VTGPSFVSGRDLANRILTERPNPNVMARTEPIEPAAGDSTDLAAGEATMAAALRPFGWTCTPVFWQRYYSDPWVFNLANAVEFLTDELAEARKDAS
jgi:hypothetical protein